MGLTLPSGLSTCGIQTKGATGDSTGDVRGEWHRKRVGMQWEEVEEERKKTL